ncbi:hypothetical protein D9619_010779 [Psilocybe cf. subviscida]|uniref:Uncharacterized protein n=1 Tax=Psilocybe cf. subviscida TaxID=2480587 RepID=A0A8H5F061_9AGAR|nr:hypothetical protein D9619_010779 [Psilocybe cf. subviscida]
MGSECFSDTDIDQQVTASYALHPGSLSERSKFPSVCCYSAMSSPAFDIDEPPPDLSQRLQRVASLRHILAANIPCALWGKEAFLWHAVVDEWHEAHVLIPDAQLAAAAAALVASGEFTTTRPARRIGVTGYDGESIFWGPYVRLFTTAPPVMLWDGYDLPDNTPSIEILLIPASTYLVDLVNEAHLFDAYEFPDQVQAANETSSSSPPSFLVPKHTTLIAGMAAFLLSNSPHSHSGMSYRYHMWCLGQYQFFSEQWDEFFPAWSPNTKEEALEVRRTVLEQLGTGTDARWLYELVIETDAFPKIIEFEKRLESKRSTTPQLKIQLASVQSESHHFHQITSPVSPHIIGSI